MCPDPEPSIARHAESNPKVTIYGYSVWSYGHIWVYWMIRCPYMGMVCGAAHAERDPKAAMDEAFAAQSYVYIQTEAEAQATHYTHRW